MVCMRVAFHENDGNHKNDEDNSNSYKQGAERWISGNHGNDRNDKTRDTILTAMVAIVIFRKLNLPLHL